MQSVLLGENPLRGGLTPARRKAEPVRGFSNNPDVPVTPIPMGVAGALPEDIVRFVLGRSSLSFKEISVVHGVVDSDNWEN